MVTQKATTQKAATEKATKAIASTFTMAAPTTPSDPPSAPSPPAANGVPGFVFRFMDMCEAVYDCGQETGNIYRAEGVRPAVVHAVSAATGGVFDVGKQAAASAPGIAQAVQQNAPAVASEAGRMAARTVDLTKAAQAKAADLLSGR